VAVLRVDASSVGVWGNSVKVLVTDATDADANHFNMTVKWLGKSIAYQNLAINATGTDNTAAAVGTEETRLVDLTKLGERSPGEHRGHRGRRLGRLHHARHDHERVYSRGRHRGNARGGRLQQRHERSGGVPQHRRVSRSRGRHGLGGDVPQQPRDARGERERSDLPHVGASVRAERRQRDHAGERADHDAQRSHRVVLQRAVHDRSQDRRRGADGTARVARGDPVADRRRRPRGLVRDRGHARGLHARYEHEPVARRSEAAQGAGVSTLERTEDGFQFRSAVTTSLVSGKEELARRRACDYLQLSAATRLRYYVKRKNTATNRTLAAGELTAFSDDLRDRERVVEDYEIDQNSVNNATQRARGEEHILWRVKLIGHILALVLETDIATGTIIEHDVAA
jgi:hypothetical protein